MNAPFTPAEDVLMAALTAAHPSALTMAHLLSYLQPDEAMRGTDLVHGLHRRGLVLFPEQGLVVLRDPPAPRGVAS